MKGRFGYQGVDSFLNASNTEYQIVLTLNNQLGKSQEIVYSRENDESIFSSHCESAKTTFYFWGVGWGGLMGKRVSPG